ncbi:MAG: hypothetical protein WCR54_07580 [Clostridia bacterium]
MIFEFPKKLINLGADYTIFDKNNDFLCSVDFVKGGLIINNSTSKLIAQVIKDKKGVLINIADSPSIYIDEDINIKEYLVADKNMDKDVDTAKRRIPKFDYFTFGDLYTYSYDLFQKSKDETKPIVIANIINNPLNDDIFKVRIDDDCNILKTLCIIFAISMLIY